MRTTRQPSKETLRRKTLGWLSLGALAGLAGCKLQEEEPDSQDTVVEAALVSENGLAMNGLAMNGLAMNGLAMNGLAMNGLAMNGLAMGGLSSTTGLMTTNAGRNIVQYMIKCALPSGHQWVAQDQNGNSYTYPGSLGVAPEWETSLCGKDCQERLSACLLAHVNNAGVHISLWIDGEGSIGWGKSPDFPYMEGAFFGNLITNQNSNNVAGGWQGYYCNGADYLQGAVPGRLGQPMATSVYTNWYGGGALCAQGLGGVNKCNLHSDGSGFDNCTISPGGVATTWNHAVTVWRNFERGLPYKMCDFTTNLCLTASGSATGSAVTAASYTGVTAQHWYITQVSSGQYKLLNASTGLALDVAASKAVQTAYTGASSQLVAVKTIPTNPGRFWLVPGSGTAVYDGGSTAGAQVVVVATTTDTAKWVLTGIVPNNVSFDPSILYRLRPLTAPNSSVDIGFGSTANGTPVQEYTSWNGDTQKFNILASGAYWKIALKLDNAKCIGPVKNGIANGTQLEVQDCSGSANQAWSGSTDGSTGSVTLRNVAAGRCLDVPGGLTANGTRMQLYDCLGMNSQKYQVQ